VKFIILILNTANQSLKFKLLLFFIIQTIEMLNHWEWLKLTLASCRVDSISWVYSAVSIDIANTRTSVGINVVVFGTFDLWTFAEAALSIEPFDARANLRDTFAVASYRVHSIIGVEPTVSGSVTHTSSTGFVWDVVRIASDSAWFHLCSQILSRCCFWNDI
jgi:hypothetical protein